jgi:general secretion pathway protein H
MSAGRGLTLGTAITSGASGAKGQTPSSDSGFTLLEALVVLAILALTATIGWTAYARRDGTVAIEATARQLAADLRLARAEAIRSNTTQAVLVDVDRRRYWTDGLPARELGGGVSLDLEIPDVERLPNRIARVRFFPDGTSGGGAIKLSTGSSQATVVVDWITGEPRVSAVR